MLWIVLGIFNSDPAWATGSGDLIYWPLASHVSQLSLSDPTPSLFPLNSGDPAHPEWRLSASFKGLSTGETSSLFFQNVRTGDITYWGMKGDVWSGFFQLIEPSNPGSLDWKLAAVADLTGSGSIYLIWQNLRSGQVVAWKMNKTATGLKWTGAPVFFDYDNSGNPDWRVVSAARIGGVNGSTHLFFQNIRTGNLLTWEIDASHLSTVLHYFDISADQISPAQRLVTVIELSTGAIEPVFQNRFNSQVSYWSMDGLRVIKPKAYQPSQPSSRDWELVAAVDLNRDGEADLIFQNRSDADIASWLAPGSVGPLDAVGPRAAADVCANPGLGTRDFIKDFGGRGDGSTDDYDAYRNAISFLAFHDGVTLIFPKGNYYLDHIGKADASRWTFMIRERTGMRIIGCDGAVINIRGDYAMTAETSVPPTIEAGIPKFVSRVVAPNAFTFSGTRNFQIEGLELAGNVQKTTRTEVLVLCERSATTGAWGCKVPSVAPSGITQCKYRLDTTPGLPQSISPCVVYAIARQSGNSGIATESGARNYVLQDLSIHDFSLDGMSLGGSKKTLPDGRYWIDQNIRISRVNSSGNARQGLSLTGVNQVRVDHSSFSYSGRDRLSGASTAFKYDPPAGGVDFEPNAAAKSYELPPGNGVFSSCSFTNNLNFQFLVPLDSVTQVTLNDPVFKWQPIQSGCDYAAWVRILGSVSSTTYVQMFWTNPASALDSTKILTGEFHQKCNPSGFW